MRYPCLENETKQQVSISKPENKLIQGVYFIQAVEVCLFLQKQLFMTVRLEEV